MTAHLESLKLYGAKKQHEPHGTNETVGTTCHNCAMLSCISQKSRLDPWRYYCHGCARRIDPHDVGECDMRDEAVEASQDVMPGWIVRDDGASYPTVMAAARAIKKEQHVGQTAENIAKGISKVLHGIYDKSSGHTWRRA